MGDCAKYADSINGNDFIFDEDGFLNEIKGTNYDFEGKLKFINELKETQGLSSKDICFIGNGGNDEWAHLSGCKTICINPDGADTENTEKWHKVVGEVSDLREILPEINNIEKATATESCQAR